MAYYLTHIILLFFINTDKVFYPETKSAKERKGAMYASRTIVFGNKGAPKQPPKPLEIEEKAAQPTLIQDTIEECLALDQCGSAMTFMHPLLQTQEETFNETALHMALCESDMNKINSFPDDHPNLYLEGLGGPKLPSTTNVAKQGVQQKTNTNNSTKERPLKRLKINKIKQSDLGNNLLETQHKADHSFQNECLKEMSTTNYKLANEAVLKRVKEHTSEFGELVERATTTYKMMFDTFGNKFENIISAAIQERNKDFAKHCDEGQNEEEDTVADSIAEDLHMRILNANNIPLLKRENIVLEFLRGAIREAGERDCINGLLCVSVQQFRQLWLKDPVLFQKTWKLTVDKDTNRLITQQKKEFDGFILREFLCPAVEIKRKRDFETEIAKFLNVEQQQNGTTEPGDNQAKLEAWLTETIGKVNPPLHGYCILCLLRLRSELATTFSSASIISNPNACAIIQHHRNEFGIPGQYKPGAEIRRGSNLCGLVGMALEYRVDNYLPHTATMKYRCLKPITSSSHGNNGSLYPRMTSAYTLVEESISVLQWKESEAIICGRSHDLDKPKNSK